MRYSIYVLLFISTTLQAQDSLKLVGVPKYKLDKLLQVYFFTEPLCDSAVNQAHNAIDSLKSAITEGQTLIQLRTEERNLKSAESNELRLALQHSQNEAKLREKKVRKRAFKSGLSIGVGIAIAVLFL